MFRGGFASDIGDVVTYLAGLGAAGAVAVRALADWRFRDARQPAALRELDPGQRTELQDTLAWILWRASFLGALAGVAIAVAALFIDGITE
jgi:hypothetical protein